MPHRLLFDLEGNGLLPELTTIHCISAADVDTGERFSWGPHELDAALTAIDKADVAIAHFGLGYDFPALKKVKRFEVPQHKRRDTVVLASLIKPDLRDTDSKLVQSGRLPGEFHGSHKLRAWGHRLGVPKADYEGPWDRWSQEMQDYCDQDINTTLELWKHLKPDAFSQSAIELEHRIALVCALMTEAGWPFDMPRAIELHGVLLKEQHELQRELKADFGFWFEPKGKKTLRDGIYVDAVFTPKKPDKNRGYDGEYVDDELNDPLPGQKKPKRTFVGYPLTRLERVDFNPGSRPHIFRQMQRLGWKPKEFTDAGQPKINDDTLLDAEEQIPQAAKLIRYLMIDKRLGQLANGAQAWMQQVHSDGRMHGRYNPLGTVTRRAAHYGPNLGQVPALKNRKGQTQPFGKECRELFHVPEDWGVQLGADMTALEMLCLCHYLTPIPNSAEYIAALQGGDPHTYHMGVTGVPDRGKMKTWYYAYIYGAGNKKLASILQLPYGKALSVRESLEGTIPTGALIKRLHYNMAVSGGFLTALDGGVLPVRSEHSALNTLLQSAGAILCKRWVVEAFDAFLARGWKHGWDGDFVFLGWIHDEVQIAVRHAIKEEAARIVIECAEAAGKPYGFRVPLAGAYKIGRNWAECH